MARQKAGAMRLDSLLLGAPDRSSWNVRRSQGSTPRSISTLQAPRTASAVSASISQKLAPKLVQPRASQDSALDLIGRHQNLFQIQDPKAELRAITELEDGLGKRHARFQQLYRGVPVWGHDLTVHLDASGSLYAFNGRYSPTFESLDVQPLVTQGRAIDVALSHLSRRSEILEMPESVLRVLDYQGPKAALYVWTDRGRKTPRLVWHVEIRPNMQERWYYFIDARTEELVESYDATVYDGPQVAHATGLDGVSRTLNVYQQGSKYHLLDTSRPTWKPNQADPVDDPQGGLQTLDARGKGLDKGVFPIVSSNNTWTDPTSVSAHFNAGVVFDYYYNNFRRLSLDGIGSTAISVIHVPDSKGEKMDNAYWNGRAMCYGDGNVGFKPLALALDVAAHEFTHAVIEKTVNLEYRFQSGALNESFADVFGCMVDSDDWRLAEDVVQPAYFPSGALRDMQDPHNGGFGPTDSGWQPDHMREYQDLTSEQDHGGVHVNSGIPNRVCSRIGDAIGREKTQKIYYRVLEAQYLNAQSTFDDLPHALITAAEDISGKASADVAAVKNALTAVGFDAGGGEGGPDAPSDIPSVQGQDWVAVINDEAGDHSPYLARPVIDSADDIVQLTSTQVSTESASPLTVTDDGELVIFVDASHNVRSINSDGTGEDPITSDGAWASISLSMDGTKFAATTRFADGRIFLFDLKNNRSRAIELYNPTTQDGERSSTVQFADALDWDLSGRFLIFDAFNSLPRTGAKPLEFWSIYIVDVDQALAGNDPPDITPIFSGFPEGISVGNPSFAQTNDNVFAFDLVDAASGIAEIWTANLFTGDAKPLISPLNSVGFPKYSPDDGHIIFQQTLGGSTVSRVQLDESKTQAVAFPELMYTGAIHPVWFAIGERTAPTQAPQYLSIAPATGPTAGGSEFTIEGRNFDPGRTEVYFDDVRASLTAQNLVYVTGMTPRGLSGFSKLRIVTPAGTTNVNDAYYYMGAPVIDRVTPPEALVIGGTKVTISGRGLKSVSAVSFGGLSGSDIELVNDTTVTCTTPVWRGQEGKVDLRIQSQAGDLTIPQGFLFNPIPGHFDVLKGKAGLKKQVWNLSITKGLLDPGTGTYRDNGREVRVLLEGTEYFNCASSPLIKEKINKKTGAVTKITIKDSQKNKLTIDLVKHTFSLAIKNIPEQRLHPEDGVTVAIAIGKVTAETTTSGVFVNTAATKVALSTRPGKVLLPQQDNRPCP